MSHENAGIYNKRSYHVIAGSSCGCPRPPYQQIIYPDSCQDHSPTLIGLTQPFLGVVTDITQFQLLLRWVMWKRIEAMKTKGREDTLSYEFCLK
jgi:hypothetical protein